MFDIWFYKVSDGVHAWVSILSNHAYQFHVHSFSRGGHYSALFVLINFIYTVLAEVGTCALFVHINFIYTVLAEVGTRALFVLSC